LANSVEHVLLIPPGTQFSATLSKAFIALEIGYLATCCRLTFAQTTSPKIWRDVQENTQPILVDDPRVLAIPIRECGEPLVDLCEYPLLTTTSHPKARSEAETRLHCREGVAQRLLRADARLPEGIRLLIVECHRPLELQDAYWKDQLESLRERHPDWPEDKLATENAKFVAPPEIVPPHSTGGAVDVVLVDAGGEELDMGSALNEKGPRMRTDAQGLLQEARRNRELLLDAMECAEFVNYPHEWWHFSYGDRYWAYAKGHSAAIYGAATLDLVARG
jgi:zinc D-Ala-D-Ala dipeptidase